MSSNESNYEASYKGRNRVTIREEDQNVAVRWAPCQLSFELTTGTKETLVILTWGWGSEERAGIAALGSSHCQIGQLFTYRCVS